MEQYSVNVMDCTTDVYSPPWKVRWRPLGLSFVAEGKKFVSGCFTARIVQRIKSDHDQGKESVGNSSGCSGKHGLTDDMGILCV